MPYPQLPLAAIPPEIRLAFALRAAQALSDASFLLFMSRTLKPVVLAKEVA